MKVFFLFFLLMGTVLGNFSLEVPVAKNPGCDPDLHDCPGDVGA